MEDYEIIEPTVYIYVDDQNRITGINPNNMEGNTGWVSITEEALSVYTGGAYDDMFDHLMDGDGVPLYKLVDGYAFNRTPEEMEADRAAMAPAEVETDTAVLNALLGVEK